MLHEGVTNFTSGNPESAITITQVDSALECLPIANPESMINLHFSSPQVEVITNGGISEMLDIETLEDSDLSYEVQLKQA